MPGNYPDKIKILQLYDGRFDACRLAAIETDEIEFRVQP